MDNYTKGVLTVIAVALVSISFQLSQTNMIDKSYADTVRFPKIQKVMICDKDDINKCAEVRYDELQVDAD
tara:strand:+ start:259 stop:468 length:210 start_codon:yes stop_codon:yes gene_type:complete